jgi:hypothetical protein
MPIARASQFARRRSPIRPGTTLFTARAAISMPKSDRVGSGAWAIRRHRIA